MGNKDKEKKKEKKEKEKKEKKGAAGASGALSGGESQVEDYPDEFPEGTVCPKKRVSPTKSAPTRGSVDIQNIVLPAYNTRKHKSPKKDFSAFSPRLWRRSKMKKDPLSTNSSPRSSSENPPLLKKSGASSPSCSPSKDTAPHNRSLLHKLRNNVKIRRDSADDPKTKEALAKFASTVNKIQVTKRISKTRTRRVGITTPSPLSNIHTDAGFITELMLGAPGPQVKRVVIPMLGGPRPAQTPSLSPTSPSEPRSLTSLDSEVSSHTIVCTIQLFKLHTPYTKHDVYYTSHFGSQFRRSILLPYLSNSSYSMLLYLSSSYSMLVSYSDITLITLQRSCLFWHRFPHQLIFIELLKKRC